MLSKYILPLTSRAFDFLEKKWNQHHTHINISRLLVYAFIVGLIVAGIFAAAMSSIDSELNALTTVFIVDWYKRLKQSPASELHFLKSSRGVTVAWGIIATFSALALGETKSIIELINQIGSYFYGSILGVFVLLLWVKRANG